ncbi:hypothetical protein E4N62_17715 [Streptomyces sp. MNU76]|uniref:hypothetical protein n=1 Tax=Streptomyces sp. MNU76 TaxID=2560026 RepID=UPI001E38846E|nr:hypothetical protein [Streptomyces sp. MNU76]MCC9706945.1 hypothetical protein [Streptomyces sp. MNU76]
MDAIERYRPKLPRPVWARIGPDCRRAVAKAGPATPKEARDWLGALAHPCAVARRPSPSRRKPPPTSGSPSSTAPKPGSACTSGCATASKASTATPRTPLYERLEDAGTRRIRGIAAQTLLLAFQLAHANRRKLRAWADSIALHDDRPRRRPTRRRKTKPLGTWTPKGYVNEP